MQSNKEDAKDAAIGEEPKPGSPEASLRESSALLERNALLSDKVFAADAQARRERQTAENSGKTICTIYHAALV